MKKYLNLTLVLSIVLSIFFSCTVDMPSTEQVEEINSAGTRTMSMEPISELKYEVIDSYFSKNLEPGKHYLVIDNIEEFDTYFNPAAVMWKKQRWVNAVDFRDNLIIAVVEESEPNIRNYSLEGIKVSDDNTLEFSYKSDKISTQGTYYRSCQIYLVQKAGYNSVAFIENGQEKAIVPVL